jgi:hypothetical protein
VGPSRQVPSWLIYEGARCIYNATHPSGTAGMRAVPGTVAVPQLDGWADC